MCFFFFSILVQFFEVDCDFCTHDIHQEDRKEEKSKPLMLRSFLTSSEQRLRLPSSTKQKII